MSDSNPAEYFETLQESLKRASELKTVIRGLGTTLTEVDDHLVPIVQVFSRGTGLYDACILLVTRYHGNESFLLGRSLFEDSVLLMEIAASDEKRQEAIGYGFERQLLRSSHEIVVLRQGLGLTGPDPVEQASHEKAVATSEQRARERGITPQTPPRRIKQARMEKLGLQEDFWFYDFCNHMVHGDAMALLTRTDGPKTRQVLYNRTLHTGLLLGSLNFASRSMIREYEACCAIVGWDAAPMDDFKTTFAAGEPDPQNDAS